MKRVPTFRPAYPLPAPAADRHRLYDRTRRNRASKDFYNSTPWKRVRSLKLSRDPLCEPCKREGRTMAATTVHHKLPLTERPDLALDLENLESICASCHSRHHASEG